MSFVGRLTRPTVAAAAIATGYTVYTAQPALADDATPRSSFGARPGRASNGDKLPIYETNAEPLVTLVEVDNPLTPYIAQARITTTDALASTSAVVKTGVSRWIDFERKAEREIKSVLPADEALTPGIIYVLIAGLSGSVLTRTRAFPIRWLTPPLFTLAAMPYFLPKTAHNLRSYLSDVEDQYAPALAEKHDILNSRLSMHWEMAKDKLGSASEEAQGLGQRAVRGIETNTGLKIGDALKRGQDKVHEQKEKLAGGVRVGAEPVKMETVGFVVETKPVAEIVAPVQANAAPVAIPNPSLNAKAEVEKPNVVAAKTPEAAVQAVVAEEVIPGAVPVAATSAPIPTPALQVAKPVETKPKEENRRLV